MAEIWILREKHKFFSIRLSKPDELQKLQWGNAGKLIFEIFSPFSKIRLNAFLSFWALEVFWRF